VKHFYCHDRSWPAGCKFGLPIDCVIIIYKKEAESMKFGEPDRKFTKMIFSAFSE